MLRSVRSKAIAAGLVLGVGTVAVWQLLPETAGGGKAIRVGTSDVVSSSTPRGRTTRAPGPCSATSTSRC